MLLIVCMRIYGDRVVSSNLRGKDVNFILGRFNYYTCVLIKHSYHKPKTLQLFCNKSFCFECRAVLVEKSMKKTQHFVYVHLYTLKNLLLFIFVYNSNLKDTRWHLIMLFRICLFFYIFCCLVTTYGIGGG